MANKRYKAAVIGCGKIGVGMGLNSIDISHAGAYSKHQRIILSGLVDVDKKNLQFSRKYFPGVPLFNSVEKMLKEVNPDIVSVAIPPEFHYKMVKKLAENKVKAIFCEKPIACSLREASEMIKTCKKNKSLLFIDHQRHFDKLLLKYRKKIKNGLVGNIFQGNCYYYNGLFNGGTHTIDLLRFFLGEADKVQAHFNDMTSWNKKDKNIDGLITFKNGAKIFIQSLTKNYGCIDFYFYGSKGLFMVKNFGNRIEYRKLENNKYYKGFYQLSDRISKEGVPKNFIMGAIDHIVECLDDSRKEAISTGEDGLAVLKILLALRKSAENSYKIIKLKKT